VGMGVKSGEVKGAVLGDGISVFLLKYFREISVSFVNRQFIADITTAYLSEVPKALPAKTMLT
jgi:hypothetical protein